MLQRDFIRHPVVVPLDIDIADYCVGRKKSRDIGLGGLCFSNESPIEPGVVVHLNIHISKSVFEVDAVVRWCQSDGERFDIGVQFPSGESAFAVRMVEQICHIRAYKLRQQLVAGRELTDEEAAAEWIQKYAHRFPGLPISTD